MRKWGGVPGLELTFLTLNISSVRARRRDRCAQRGGSRQERLGRRGRESHRDEREHQGGAAYGKRLVQFALRYAL